MGFNPADHEDSTKEELRGLKRSSGDSDRRVPRPEPVSPPPGYANGKAEEFSNVKVPDRLTKLGDIYRERNAIYGDTYKNFGAVMKSFFPKPLTLDKEEDWNRIGLFFHLADKLARYSASFPRGVVGHVDSLDDLSVYSQMLQEYDQDVRLGTAVKK